jgi:Zn-dependent protease with chaperone function
LGIFGSILSRLFKAKPFQSESLDQLAEVMKVAKILKKNKLDRYYTASFLRQGGMASSGRVFFDAKYFEKLLPGEVMAVAAHEFTHLNCRHGLKKFVRLLLPAILIGTSIGVFVFFNFGLITSLPIFSNLGKVESCLGLGVFSILGAMIASSFVNARWLRQQETDCDLSSVEFLNGESMVSALIKLNELRSMRFESRLIPKLYPSLEERISDIQKAEKKAKTINFLPHN